MVRYRYPKLCNWMEFRPNDDGSYAMKDWMTGREFTLGGRVAKLARQLDGRTDPYTALPGVSRESVTDMLESLEEASLLRHSRVYRTSGTSVSLTLLIPRKYRTQSRIPVVINDLLLALWLPALMLGIWLVATRMPLLEGGSLLWGQLLGILAGMVFHELGHAMAGLSYGGRFFEAGVMMNGILPCAYVLLDYSTIQKRMHRVQSDAAGVEMNFLLTGLALTMMAWMPGSALFWFGFALQNLGLGLINLVFLEGLDGMSILCGLLGIREIPERGRRVLRSRAQRRKLLDPGIQGFVQMTVYVSVLLCQTFWLVLMGLTVLEVFSWL